jgi:hypothetical protein
MSEYPVGQELGQVDLVPRGLPAGACRNTDDSFFALLGNDLSRHQSARFDNGCYQRSPLPPERALPTLRPC